MTPAVRIRSKGPVDDAAAFGRRVRDRARDGTHEFAKSADVPHLVEVGRDSAAAAVGDVVDRATRGRRRSRRVGPALLVAVCVVLALGAWLLIRSDSFTTMRAVRDDDDSADLEPGAAPDRGLEATALTPTGDGTGRQAALADVAALPLPPDGRPAPSLDLG